MPELIQDNVAFWTAVYTKLPESHGFIHDRDFPLVILETVLNDTTGSATKADAVSRRKSAWADAIRSAAERPPSHWGAMEKRVDSLYRAHAKAGALVGAAERLRFQQGQRERFRSGLERSTLYLDTIRAILRRHGLPAEIAALPHVESSFDPEALSRVGAAGLWQFMRSTGALFLRIDYDIDERLDPLRSTVAAARLLRQNYDALKSWPLAITAYNYGLGGMKRAVAAAGTNDIAAILKGHESPTFRFASRNFYACFVAALRIAAMPDSFFADLRFAEPVTYVTTTLPARLSPSAICARLRVSDSVFRGLNPAIRASAYQFDRPIPRGYSINLPPKTDLVSAQRRLLAPSVPPASTDSAVWEYYTVTAGDNLLAIASRLGVGLPDLMACNQIAKADRIFVGQVLRVRVAAAGAAERMSAASPPPVRLLSRTGPPAGAPTPSVAESVAAAALTAASSEPAFGAAGPSPSMRAFDADVYSLSTVLKPGGSFLQIRVAVDEDLGRLAGWIGTSVMRLRQINGLDSSGRVTMGRVLDLPTGEATDLRCFEASRLEFHMAIEEDFWTRYEVIGVQRRTLKRGETAWGLCARERIPVWLFLKCNPGLETGRSKTGAHLNVPLIRTRGLHVPPAELGGVSTAQQALPDSDPAAPPLQ